jgi:hypothetical protein
MVMSRPRPAGCHASESASGPDGPSCQAVCPPGPGRAGRPPARRRGGTAAGAALQVQFNYY